MYKYIHKIKTLLGVKMEYPDLIYFGAPRVLSLLGLNMRDLPKSFYSQHGQDSLIFSEFFNLVVNPKFPKTFLDVGCNDPIKFSNSLFFEKFIGFQTIAIDALEEMQSKWKNVRPSARFVHSAVGDKAGSLTFQAAVGTGNDSMLSSVVDASQKITGKKIESRTVPVRTIDDILDDMNAADIGVASIDVEGYEFAVLNGWKNSTRKIYILIVENNENFELGKANVRDFLVNRGYCYFGRIWNMDDIFVSAEGMALLAASRQTESD
jgi:FkbM family methyltransferase